MMATTKSEVVPPRHSTALDVVQTEGKEGERSAGGEANSNRDDRISSEAAAAAAAAAAEPTEGLSTTTAIQQALAALALSSEKSSSVSGASFPEPSKHQRKVRSFPFSLLPL